MNHFSRISQINFCELIVHLCMPHPSNLRTLLIIFFATSVSQYIACWWCHDTSHASTGMHHATSYYIILHHITSYYIILLKKGLQGI